MKFANIPLVQADITSPERGRLRARVVSDVALPRGGLLAAEEGPTVTCTVVGSTLEQGLFVSTIVAGKGTWSNPVDATHFAGSLPMSDVVRSVAAMVGEPVDTSAVLGEVPHYMLPAGVAAQVLDGIPWHVADNGTTIAGAARKGTKRADIHVESVDAQNGLLRGTADGLVLSGDSVVHVYDGAETTYTLAEVWQEADRSFVARTSSPTVADALRSIVRGAQITTLEAYDATGAEFSAQFSGVPQAVRELPRWLGPGHTAELAPSTPVIVGFLHGERTRPVVVSVAPSPAPLSLQWQATQRVRLDAPSVALGPSGGTPVALAPATVAAFQAIALNLTTKAAPLAAGAPAGAPVLGAALAAILGDLAKEILKSLASSPIPSTSVGVD